MTRDLCLLCSLRYAQCLEQCLAHANILKNYLNIKHANSPAGVHMFLPIPSYMRMN